MPKDKSSSPSKTKIKPKTYTKKKKSLPKTESKPRNISMYKSYWLFLGLLAAVFTMVFGFALNMSLGITVMMLATVIIAIGFVSYIRFKPSIPGGNRPVFLFVSGCVIGFITWAVILLVSAVSGILAQIVNSIGGGFFSITLIMCWFAGAFIGDVLGRRRNYVLPNIGF